MTPSTDPDPASLAEALSYYQSWLGFQQRYRRLPGLQAGVYAGGAGGGGAHVRPGLFAGARGLPEHRLALEDVYRDRGCSSFSSAVSCGWMTQATYLRRQDALAQTAGRLKNKTAVSEGERTATLDTIDTAHQHRADHLSDRSAR